MVVSWFYDLKLPHSEPRHAPAVAADSRTAIVVLPFANMSGDPDNEYFSDGVSEEITNALTRIAGLRVVSRTSAYSFRGKDASAREIGDRLGVEFVLEGSVRRAGERLRMSAKLARVSDDSLLWSETYERVLDDVFAVQDEVTRKIVETISRTLLRTPMTLPEPVRAPSNLHAYDLYLLGRHHWNKRTEPGMRKALELFEQAVAIDPSYGPAFSGIADASAVLASWQFAEPADMYPKAVVAARRALDLDENLAEAHASLGFIHYQWDWDWDGAVRELHRAIELNPNLENAHRWLSAFLAGIGRYEEALPIALKVPTLDPLSVLPHMNLGIIHLLSARYDSALAEFERVMQMDPGFLRAGNFAGVALSFLGRHDEAVAITQRTAAAGKEHAINILPLGICLVRAGRIAEAREALDPIMPALPAFYHASVHASLQEEAAMYDELERGIAAHDDWMYSIGTQPWFREYRDQPRFKALMRQLNLPEVR
jgi:serine/threonine-protein kinase